MFSCEKISRLYSDSLEEKLSLRQRMQLRLHMLMCTYCSRFREQIQFLREAARRAHQSRNETDSVPVEGLSAEARGRIKKAVDEARP